MRLDRHGRDVIRQRKDDTRRNHALHGGKHDLFGSHRPHRQRTHHPVVDLARDAKLLRQRQRDCGDAGEHDRDRHQPWQQHRAEATAGAGHLRGRIHATAAAAHMRQHVGKHKQEQQRVHAHANRKRKQLAPQHV